MVIVTTDNKHYADIAAAIREKTGTMTTYKPEQMAEGIGAVYAAGKAAGGGGGLAYDMGEFVLDEDVRDITIASGGIPHALGEAPTFVVVWTDDFADLSADNLASQQCNIGFSWMYGLTGMQQGLTTSVKSDFGIYCSYSLKANGYDVGVTGPTSNAYMPTEAYAATDAAFGLPIVGQTYRYRAGVTYKYFVAKGWW